MTNSNTKPDNLQLVVSGDSDDDLLFQRMPLSLAVSTEMIQAQKTPGAAFDLACRASGLLDKEIYTAIGIDAGYFSNIKTSKATLQADKEAAFCDRVGNLIYSRWRAYQIGCDLVMLKSEAERRTEAAEKRADMAEQEKRELRRELETLKSVIRDRMVTL